MESSFGFVSIIIAAAALAALVYVFAALLSGLVPAVGEVCRGIGNDMGAVFRVNAGAAAHRRRQRQLRTEIDAELGNGGKWADPDEDIIRAAERTRLIATVDKKLRQSIHDCNDIHWQLVDALGSDTMSAAATHPLAQTARVRVVDLAELLTSEIADYPWLTKAPQLLALGFGARRLGSACLGCPYFFVDVEHAPRPCPALAAVSAAERDQQVKDGQTVD